MKRLKKTCYHCKTEKPAAAFYPNRCRPDQLSTACKVCCIVLRRKWSEENKDYANRRDRAYYRKHSSRIKASSLSRKRSFPQRTAAQAAVRNAIRRGILTPEPCFICGRKAEAHHPSYDLPLDVTWLCIRHHRRLHAEVSNYA